MNCKHENYDAHVVGDVAECRCLDCSAKFTIPLEPIEAVTEKRTKISRRNYTDVLENDVRFGPPPDC